MPARTLSPLPLPFPKIGKVWRRHHRSSSRHPEAQPLLDHPPEEARPNGFLDWKSAQRYHWAKLPDLVDDELHGVNYAIVPKLLQAGHTKSGDPQPAAKNFAATPVSPRPPRAVISPLYSIPRRSTFNLARGSKTRLRANKPTIVQLRKDHSAYQPKPFLPTPLSPIKEDYEKEQFSYDAPRWPPGLHGIKGEPDKEQIGFPQQSDASHGLAGTINPFDDLFALEYEKMNFADMSLLEDDFPSVSDGVNASGIHELILKEVVSSKLVKILSNQARHAEQVVEYSG